MNQLSLLADAGEPAGLPDQTIIQIKRRPHTYKYVSRMHMAQTRDVDGR